MGEPMAPFQHIVVPVASEEDAIATCAALRPYLDSIERITVVHVIEKGGGSIDKAPMEKRRADAAEFLAIVEARLGDEATIDRRTEFGTDVVETIVETGLDTGATAIAFRPRGGSRILRLLSGDTATCLVTDPKLPVISLPDMTEE